jgi:hypothetical protein
VVSGDNVAVGDGDGLGEKVDIGLADGDGLDWPAAQPATAKLTASAMMPLCRMGIDEYRTPAVLRLSACGTTAAELDQSDPAVS